METTGKVFVITGGGNGIGREVVSGLLKRGAQVAAVDRSEESLAETARLAAAAYAGLSTHTVDITDCAVIERLPAEVHAVHGQVDGVLNVAGIVQRFARVHDLGHDEIEKVMAVNFWGVVNMVKAFVPVLLERPEASLVNAYALLDELSGGTDTQNGQIVWRTDGTAVDDPAVQAEIADMLDAVAAETRVTAVVSPYADDGSSPQQRMSKRATGSRRARSTSAAPPTALAAAFASGVIQKDLAREYDISIRSVNASSTRPAPAAVT